LLISISSDVGGYLVGKRVGGVKLTKISPNKTIAGTIGSFIFSLIPLFIYNYFFVSFSISVNNLLFCLGISALTQLGDLFISYLKRLAKIKDSGDILPGHGGMLDRIDCIIFALPFAHFIVNGFSFFEHLELFFQLFN
jgi:phosphatidate cytidylyltransferase